MADLVNVDRSRSRHRAATSTRPEFYAAMQNGEIASVWMPQWYMTRFPDNMDSLCGNMIVRPMPLFEEGGFTTTMGGGTGTAVTDQTPAEKQAARQGVPGLRQAHEGSPEGPLDTDLGFDPYRPDVYDDPDLLGAPIRLLQRRGSPFDVIRDRELGNVAPEYTGPLYPEARTYMQEPTLPNAIVSDGVPAADALAEAQSQTEAMAVTQVCGTGRPCRSGPQAGGRRLARRPPSHAGMLRT